jgi:hypothetical protein
LYPVLIQNVINHEEHEEHEVFFISFFLFVFFVVKYNIDESTKIVKLSTPLQPCRQAAWDCRFQPLQKLVLSPYLFEK